MYVQRVLDSPPLTMMQYRYVITFGFVDDVVFSHYGVRAVAYSRSFDKLFQSSNTIDSRCSSALSWYYGLAKCILNTFARGQRLSVNRLCECVWSEAKTARVTDRNSVGGNALTSFRLSVSTVSLEPTDR